MNTTIIEIESFRISHCNIGVQSTMNEANISIIFKTPYYHSQFNNIIREYININFIKL